MVVYVYARGYVCVDMHFGRVARECLTSVCGTGRWCRRVVPAGGTSEQYRRAGLCLLAHRAAQAYLKYGSVYIL